MKWLISILLFLSSFGAQAQLLKEYELPYKSVTKQLVRDEQFSYYCDDNFVYMYFKPSLVSEVQISTYVNGILTSIIKYKVRPHSDILEGRRRQYDVLMIVTIRDEVYFVRVPAREY